MNKKIMNKLMKRDMFQRLYMGYKIIKYKEIFELVKTYTMKNEDCLLDDNVIFFRCLGNKNAEKKLYLISYGTEKQDMTGFCAMIRRSIYRLLYAEFYNLTPVIYWGPHSSYTEDKVLFNTDNGFEYYFKPISEINYLDAMQSKHICFSKHSDGVEIYPNYDRYDTNESEFVRIAEVYKRYFILNERTKAYIDKSVEEKLGTKKTLAIHVRGGDYKINYNGHPQFDGFEKYIIACKKVMQEMKFEQIFLATDDKEALDMFQEAFGEKIVFYNDFQRAKGKQGLHLIKNERENDKYKKGLEILRDVYTLANCDGIITGLSQVAYAVRYINISLGRKFLYDEFIRTKLNNNKKYI